MILAVLLSGKTAFAANTTIRLQGRSHKIKVERPQILNGMLAVEFENGSKATLLPSVLVKFKSQLKMNVSSWPEVRSQHAHPILNDIQVVHCKTPEDALEVSKKLTVDPRVEYAHPDLIFPLEARGAFAPQEDLFKFQWNLENTGQNGGTPGADIGVASAWQITKGSPKTLIAVLDLGFEQEHHELDKAWFQNPKEIPGNKKDDDHNGLVDDVQGWNFSINGNNLIYGQGPQHGTAVSGIIAAKDNGRGVTGICPACKILPVVVSGRVSEDAAAIAYAVSMGATVITNSWGYALNPPATDVVTDALTSAAKKARGGLGIPVIFAMRNVKIDDCHPGRPDISAHPHVIAVSSADHHNKKVETSGYGSCLKFVAPTSGSSKNGIATVDRLGAKGYNQDGKNNFADLDYTNGFYGTSAATPHVAAAFGLMFSVNPDLSKDEALSRLIQSAEKVHPEDAKYNAAGHSDRYGYGRLDLRNLNWD
jgi:subtilisin family serine protease